MNNLINDLDSNVASEFFHGINGSRTAAISINPISPNLPKNDITVIGTPQNISLSSSPKPRTQNQTVSQPNIEAQSIPRPMSPKVLSENKPEEQSNTDMPILSGGVGGAGMRMSENEDESENQEDVIIPKKTILGLSEKTFYIGLGIIGISTYLYFKKFKSTKQK